MAGRKKASHVAPENDSGIEFNTLGGFPEDSDTGRKRGRDVSIQANDAVGSRRGKEPMEKMMMRLPQSLAREFQRVYLELTARKFNENGKKLLLQDCYVEMVREWIERQTQLLNKQAGVLDHKRLSQL